MSGKRRFLYVMTATVIGVVLGAATMVVAGSGPTLGTGSDINRVKTAASTTSQQLVSPSTLAELTGARHRLALTANSTLVVARFTGESICTTDTTPGFCNIQVFVHDNNAADALIDVMRPGDPGFDTTPVGNREVHTVEKSITLPPGDYDFQVVMSTFPTPPPPAITFTLNSWHFTVERIA